MELREEFKKELRTLVEHVEFKRKLQLARLEQMLERKRKTPEQILKFKKDIEEKAERRFKKNLEEMWQKVV